MQIKKWLDILITRKNLEPNFSPIALDGYDNLYLPRKH